MFVILDNGAMVNTRHVAGVFPLPPAGYPAGAEPRFVLRLIGVVGGDVIITKQDYEEILGAIT